MPFRFMPRCRFARPSAAVAALCCLLCGTLSPFAQAQVSMLTQHNDTSRTGQNLNETTLNVSNVNSTQFGKLFTRAADGEIYAQPLYVPNLAIPGKGTHNVVYLATMNNSVYAYDADDPAASTPLWQANFGTPVNASDVQCCCTDISTKVGILGTPVIDPGTNTIYFVSRNKNTDGTYHQFINALDITTGTPKFTSPREIIAASQGVTFDPKRENQRPGLLLLNGVVYVAWASHNDCQPYHGWVISFVASNLQQLSSYVNTPTGSEGGIWQAGQGLTADADGNIYLMSGNGTATTDGKNLGCSFIKLKVGTGGALSMADWFTPFNVTSLNNADADLGASGVLGLPGTNYLVGGGKEGKIYLLNRNNMGHFQANSDSQIVQSFAATNGHIHGSPIYYNSPVNGASIYVWSEYDTLKVFKFTGSSFLTTPIATSTMQVPGGMPGAMMTISANGSTAGSAIVWASHPYSANANNNVVEGIVRAFDANTIVLDGSNKSRLKEIWNSKQNAARDNIGNFAKFCAPTVANGKVYVPNFGPYGASLGGGQLIVYGLFAPPSPPSPPANLTAAAGGNGINLTWTAGAGASTYNVKRSLTNGGPYTPLASGITALGYADSGLTSGVTYYYVVSSVNVSGESANSNQASAVPPPPPPMFLTADAGNMQVAVNWNSVPNALTYSIKRGSAAAGPFSTLAAGLLHPGYTDRRLSNGSTYFYVVSATYPAGESADSPSVSAIPKTITAGLTANYYNDPGDGTYFNVLAKTRIDPSINFIWDGIAPSTNVQIINFSVRWSGVVTPHTSETYTFTTTTDDGVRLWVNGQLIIDKWLMQAATDWSGTADLTANQSVPIVMEYFQAAGNAQAQLAWASPSVVQQTVPQNRLSPAATISGTVTLQGYTNPGGVPVTFVCTPSDGTGAAAQTQTLAADGSFALTGLALKNYSVAVKGAIWLQKTVSVDASSGSTAGVMITLPGGDADGSNRIDFDDFLELLNAFGSTAADAGSGYDPHADFTGNGTVDFDDFLILLGNWGEAGDN